MIVYHGGYCEVTQPHIKAGKYSKDFGVGFYCTELKEQAVRWAKRYDIPTLNNYEYKLADNSFKVFNFTEMTEEWLDFIVACRKGKKHEYDIVIGAMANDQVYNYISDYLNGILTREQFWVLAKFKHPTHQIAFCTDNALKCLTFLSSEEVG